MSKEKVLVIGLGEVGRPLYELLDEHGEFSVFGLDLDDERMREVKAKKPPSKVDVMHVCIPYGSQAGFARSIVDYVSRFKPKLVIVESTIPPGTVEKLQEGCCCHIAHSPVRGVHVSPEHMKWELRRWTKYVGGVDAESAELASEHFKKLGLKVKVLRSARETELAKLFETAYRAWMIACFQEMHRMSRHFGADFNEVVDFLEDTHRVRLDRPPMFPGVISGHCLIPNVKLLLQGYDSEFLHLILKSNEKRREEIKEVGIADEVVKIRERTRVLEEELLKTRMPRQTA